MGMWLLWLVLILLMMVVVGSRFGSGNDEDEEIGSRTCHGEEEEERGRRRRKILRVMRGQKKTQHLCGSMWQGLGEGEGVEPQSLHASIVIKLTQVMGLWTYEKAFLWAYAM